jgi:hypothetical protein
MVTCARCEATADELPLTWVTSAEADGLRYYCDRCARENLRSIEAKLDSEWWG